jgi:hypothetical protein
MRGVGVVEWPVDVRVDSQVIDKFSECDGWARALVERLKL